jgi:hypothetical protein
MSASFLSAPPGERQQGEHSQHDQHGPVVFGGADQAWAVDGGEAGGHCRYSEAKIGNG